MTQQPEDNLKADPKSASSNDLDFKLDQDVSLPPEQNRREQQLDYGDEKPRFRENWWQFWRPRDPPPPPPESFSSATLIPLVHASLFSILTYTWITPIMTLGYQRALQATDLWKMDPDREAATLGRKLDAAWARRVEKANDWNARVQSGKLQPGLATKLLWGTKALSGIGRQGWRSRYQAYKTRWSTREASLAWALNDTFGWHFWLGGVAKAIINFGKARFAAIDAGVEPPSFGPGIGMAIGLFCITILASVMQHQFFWRSMSTGVLARAALIASIYKRGVALAPSARASHTSSALVNHISTDVSRIDAAAHAYWTAPIQVTVCLIILLVQLGPSALAGFSLFLIMTPIQERAMVYQFAIRQRSVIWTDRRAKLVQELLGAMRVVKWFTYEGAFLKRIGFIRNMELKGIWRILLIRAANQAVAYSIPVLAAVLAFVTFSLSGNSFDSAVIFSSLSLFSLLRQPLMFLPRSLSVISDAQSALIRLKRVFHAELMHGETFDINPELDVAVRIDHASFEWEEGEDPEKGKERGKKNKGNSGKDKGVAGTLKDAFPETEGTPQAPFAIKDLNIVIPRGQLCGIVGPVGSGKSSLLLGLIGEMRRTGGSSVFGGSVAYCAQSAWIQNATLRDNVLFGRPFDQEKYWKVIQDASLVPDLEVLPDGDLTEIGEKGINLSGGQKQRVNIARALYYDADIVLFDDPLSAVDAHVGKALFNHAILGALKDRGKTVLLVTHALHFLPQVDYIYTLVNGKVAERGSYDELTRRNGPFAKLVAEFGGGGTKEEEATEPDGETTKKKNKVSYETLVTAAGTGKVEGRLMKAEKRTVGSVSFKVYVEYLRAGKGIWTMPVIIVTAFLMQTSQVLNSYTLVWWQANLHTQLYGCLGVSQAIFTFALGSAMSLLSILASENLHWEATQRIFHAPMSVFDTTPLGRMLSVLGKDIDVVDNQLSESARMFVVIIAGVCGSVVIITIVEHYFIIAVFFILMGYMYFAAFYRSSSRELKRLDASLRSLLYSHFSESLTGLATIRAYREVPRFLTDNEYYCDLEDRALYLTITNQRWLAVRLDFLGAMMVFIVGMMTVFGVNGINPAQIGLVLTYTTSLTQMFGMTTRQSAEVENYMNSVERVVHYSHSDLIEQEAPYEKEDVKPPADWPSGGAIDFNDVVMSYRPGLPAVLRGISAHIHPGEKIGVVGRQSSSFLSSSSLMIALFRLVELDSGSIFIDGIDIAPLGLRDLRSKIAIIPQDPTLFSGTIRSNLDPFSVYDDARLWDALRRAYLVDSPSEVDKLNEKEQDIDDTPDSGAQTPASRFNLETIIESEGANLSVGERSLLSLSRALTPLTTSASVDLETDSKIQYTIQTEFHDRTLLCIAHRLRTILNYDRIMVLEAGQIVEFGRPIDLFLEEDGIFHGMCAKSNITRNDIEKSSRSF
ncbi:ABC protein [Ramaria rubella]|nr:ABC protein [Ramaria rubella]